MPLTLPSTTDIEAILGRLLGESPSLSLDSDHPDLASLTPSYASVYFDDDGTPTAAVVADLNASLYLGGKLIMMPMSRLREDAEEPELSEIVLDALSEVFNNFTSCFNEIEGNPHLRASPAVDAVEVFADLPNPKMANRLDLVGDFLEGNGRIALVGL